MPRLFIAIRIPDVLSQRIHKDAEKLMKKAHKGRLLDPDSYHITMAFLGAVADDRVDCIKAVMDKCSVRDFNLMVRGFSIFKGDRGDLIFREVDGERIFYNLQEKLVRLLKREGFILGKQSFIPHITVVRRVYGLNRDTVRSECTEGSERAEKAEKSIIAFDNSSDATFPAASLCLMETIQEGNGVSYRCLYELCFVRCSGTVI